MKREFFIKGLEGKRKEHLGMFMKLYPGEDIRKKYREYQQKKRTMAFAVMLTGVGLFLCAQVSSHMQHNLIEGTHLIRNEWDEGNYSVTLEARTVSQKEKLTYQVQKRKLEKEELETYFIQLKEELPNIIVGNNEGLWHVRNHLNLISTHPEYPFSIVWKSSDYSKISTTGEVSLTEVKEQGEVVELTAICSYEDYNKEILVKTRLLPPLQTEKEKYLEKITALLEREDSCFETENALYLPLEVDGEEVLWEEKSTENGFVWLFLGGICVLLVIYKANSDLQKKAQKRNEEIIRSYPEFISKLKLYIGAGLTIKNAFLRIGKDYRLEKQRTGKKEYLYEELLIAGYQLNNGKSEEYVYRDWARRCEVMCCRKLGFLLASTLRQGNERMLSLLDKEVCLAWEERKTKAKKQGEEVGGKMLIPMLMMLLMVMFLILLPAFSGLQNV